MKKSIWFAVIAVLALVTAGTALAGTRSEGAAGADIIWANPPAPLDSWSYFSDLPRPECEQGDRTVLESGQGVDAVYGVFDVQYATCLKAIPFPPDANGNVPPWPQYWLFYNMVGGLSFYTPAQPAYPPGKPTPGTSTMDIAVDDHYQTIDYDIGLGMPEDGWVQGRIVGGTGRFENANGVVKIKYAVPQLFSGLDDKHILMWYTMVVN